MVVIAPNMLVQLPGIDVTGFRVFANHIRR